MDFNKMFEEMQSTGISQSEIPEAMTWDNYVQQMSQLAQDDKMLKELILQKKQEELIQSVTFQDILLSSFTAAKEAIAQMTLAQRIDMLQEAEKYREYLYESVNKYGAEGLTKDEQISAADFRLLLGRIKHLEILINWLFGIL